MTIDVCPDCGGGGTRYVSMCAKHQAENLEIDARRMGIPDLVLDINDPNLLLKIRDKFPTSLSGFLIIKVI